MGQDDTSLPQTVCFHDGSLKMFWKASVSEIGEVIFVNLCCTYVFFRKSVLELHYYNFLLLRTFELKYEVYEKEFFLCCIGVVFIVICILKYFQEETLGFQEED